jgi:tetratricopeptide (TPR) repeat protein
LNDVHSRGYSPRRAAEAVCGRAGIDAREVFDLLTQLVDKSLVQVETHEGKERYRLLETIRQYGRDRLVDAGEAENVRNNHFDWFLELAERGEPELIGPRQVAWLDRLETEQDNFRAALSWGLDRRPAIEGLRLAGALWRLWFVRDRESEGLDWLRQALTAPGAEAPTAARAKALQGVWELTHFAAGASSLEQARAAEESLTICQEIGDQVGAAWSIQMVGRQACYQVDYVRARALLEQALVLAQKEHARWVMAQVLEGLGVLAVGGDDLIVARRHFEEAQGLFRELGDRRAICIACSWAGSAARLLGDYATAQARWSEGLRISRELGSRVRTAHFLMRLAALSNIDGDYEQSRALLAEGRTIARDIGARWLNGLGLVLSEWLARLEGDNNQALALTIEALKSFHASAVPRGVRLCLGNLGVLATEAGRVRLGVGLLAGAASIRDVDRVPWRLYDDPRAGEAAKDAARTALGDREFELAWAEGQAMTREQAVAYALAENDT